MLDREIQRVPFSNYPKTSPKILLGPSGSGKGYVFKNFLKEKRSTTILSSSKDMKTEKFQKIYIYPLTLKEAVGEKAHYVFEFNSILRFGLLPKVFLEKNEKEKKKLLLKNISNFLPNENYSKILKYISLNICKEVTLEEISQEFNMRKECVFHILRFFEEYFVIKKLENFEKIPKKRKYYFYDIGVRNAVMDNFKNFDKRKDFYKIYENFLIMERIKRLEYNGERRNYFYWKNEKGLGLPWVEMKGEYLEAFEFEKEAFTSRNSIYAWIEAYRNRKAGFTYVYDSESFQRFIFRKTPLHRTE